ncbi:hypothetical protein RCL1_008171 [Eukaryota sp. TZLM3-RCL]
MRYNSSGSPIDKDIFCQPTVKVGRRHVKVINMCSSQRLPDAFSDWQGTLYFHTCSYTSAAKKMKNQFILANNSNHGTDFSITPSEDILGPSHVNH